MVAKNSALALSTFVGGNVTNTTEATEKQLGKGLVATYVPVKESAKSTVVLDAGAMTGLDVFAQPERAEKRVQLLGQLVTEGDWQTPKLSYNTSNTRYFKVMKDISAFDTSVMKGKVKALMKKQKDENKNVEAMGLAKIIEEQKTAQYELEKEIPLKAIGIMRQVYPQYAKIAEKTDGMDSKQIQLKHYYKPELLVEGENNPLSRNVKEVFEEYEAMINAEPSEEAKRKKREQLAANDPFYVLAAPAVDAGY